MVLGEDGLQIFGEVAGLLGVAVGDVGDEVDEVVEGLGLLGGGRGRRD